MRSGKAPAIGERTRRRAASDEDRESPLSSPSLEPPGIPIMLPSPSSALSQLQLTGGSTPSPEHLHAPALPFQERPQSPPRSGMAVAPSPSQQLPCDQQPAGCPGRIPSLPKKKKITYWFADLTRVDSMPVSNPGQASYREATEYKQSELDLPLSALQPQLSEGEPHVLKSEKKKKNKKKKKGKRNKRGQSSKGTSQEKQEIAQGHLDSQSSSSYSSPLREPQVPLVPWKTTSGKVVHCITDDPTAQQAYYWASHEYENKRARQEQLATLRPSYSTDSGTTACYSFKQKEILLNASKSVMSLSAYHDGREINQCTGIVVEWDEVKKSAIILTSAWIFCTKKPFDDWSYKDYAPDAKVTVHMLDETISECRLLYFSQHFDIAFFETVGGLTIPIVPLKPDLEYGQDLCVLARDRNRDLICTTAKVQHLDPYEHQHNHYLFIDGSIPKSGTGGALADFSGNIVGMLFCTLPTVAFIPSSLILTCLRLWKMFGRFVRPQLGLKLRTVGFQEMAHIELISRKYNITSGLIVVEVSAHCAAEKHGIRVGDVILSCQGKSISSATQFEEILLGIGEEHLEKGNGSSSTVDVKVEIYHVRKCIRRPLTLSVELSDDIEVFHSGSATFTDGR